VEFLHLGTRVTAWLWLGFEMGGIGGPGGGIHAVTIAVILVAAAGTVLRVWGTAYLGPSTVNSMSMRAGHEVLADGPYRYMRNPLYLGTWLLALAISVLMPVSGAVVSLLLLAVFFLRLIFAEEAFLTSQLGSPYDTYRMAVPRLLPRAGRHIAGEIKGRSGAGRCWGRFSGWEC